MTNKIFPFQFSLEGGEPLDGVRGFHFRLKHRHRLQEDFRQMRHLRLRDAVDAHILEASTRLLLLLLQMQLLRLFLETCRVQRLVDGGTHLHGGASNALLIGKQKANVERRETSREMMERVGQRQEVLLMQIK